MELLKATIDNLDDVYKLLCELEDEVLDKSIFAEIYKDNVNNKSIHYILAIVESNVIGFGSLHIQKLLHHCSNIAEVQEIIISKNQQGSGIGTMIFDELKRIATSSGCLQLEVCCNLSRSKSHEFYLKQGMEKSHYKFTCVLN